MSRSRSRRGDDSRSRTALAVVVTVAMLAMATAPAVASHGDGDYDQTVWFEWDETDLDVILTPNGHGQIFNGNGVLNGLSPSEAIPCETSYMQAIRDAIAGWEAGIDTFGPDWLKNGLNFNVYAPGCGPEPPQSALLDPEIVVYTDETKTVILGFAVSTDPCLVNNSKFFVQSFTYADMYNVMGQEFGHCLGLNHVGDNHPQHDTLDGTYDDQVGAAGNHLHCVSNLNVEGLKHVFDQSLGENAPGNKGTVDVGNYTQWACE